MNYASIKDSGLDEQKIPKTILLHYEIQESLCEFEQCDDKSQANSMTRTSFVLERYLGNVNPFNLFDQIPMIIHLNMMEPLLLQ